MKKGKEESIYCQICGIKTTKWFDVEFRKKTYVQRNKTKKEDRQVISENIKVCEDCKKT